MPPDWHELMIPQHDMHWTRGAASRHTSAPIGYTGVFYHIAAVHLHLLQSVLNAAACILFKLCKFNHVLLSRAIHNELHWLSIDQWIVYKLWLMVYKCQHHWAPSYLSSLCHPSQLVATCWLQPRKTWILHVQQLLHVVLVLLQFLDLRAGTIYPYP